MISGSGENIPRNDCQVIYEPDSNKLLVKLEELSPETENQLTPEMLRQWLKGWGVEKGSLEVRSSGAVPAVVHARLESALGDRIQHSIFPRELTLRQFHSLDDDLEFRPRTWMYVPANQPKLIYNPKIRPADALVFDLEDSVPADERPLARKLARNALLSHDYGTMLRCVRINPGTEGLVDLEEMLTPNLNIVLIPKAENAEHIQDVETQISAIQKQQAMPTSYVRLIPIIETALGVHNALEIANSSERVMALALGLEDYTADLGVERTLEARESLFARSMLVNAAVAAGKWAIDSVFSQVKNDEGLRVTVAESKGLGFKGMGCIHPQQIDIIHGGFAPSHEEIVHAQKILNALESAQKEGRGVFAVDAKMVDAPVIERARRTINEAERAGLIS